MNKRRRDQRQMTTSGSRPLSTQPVLTKLRRDQPLPQAVTAVEIPPPWRDQSAVAEGVYFTIPPGLLDMVAESVGRDRFVAEELRRERALGQAADMEHGNVGFDRGRPIAYQFLAPPPPTAFHSDLLAQAAKEWGMTVGALTNSIQMSAERSATLHNPLRGYVGWLLTSREFLDEHDQLIDHHWTRIRADGMPQPLWGIAGGEELRLVNEDDWVIAYRTFCERWRLQSLAAPSLRTPIITQHRNLNIATG